MVQAPQTVEEILQAATQGDIWALRVERDMHIYAEHVNERIRVLLARVRAVEDGTSTS